MVSVCKAAQCQNQDDLVGTSGFWPWQLLGRWDQRDGCLQEDDDSNPFLWLLLA